jgi:hypothetical protein
LSKKFEFAGAYSQKDKVLESFSSGADGVIEK